MIRRIRTSLTITPVPRPYDPGYPARLPAEEFARLIRARPVKTGIVAAAIALIAAQAGEGPQEKEKKPDDGRREEVVLDILRNQVKYGHWLEYASMSRKHISTAYRQIERPTPRVPIMFGNSLSGLFDIEVARKNALAVFEAYGLKPNESAVIKDSEVEATISGLAADKKHGFILRTPKVAWENPFGSGSSASDPAEVALSDAESKVLVERGMDLLIADQSAYPVYDGDTGVPQGYWVAAVVEYLNALDDGFDVHVESALWGDLQEIGLPRPRVAEGDAVLSADATSVKAKTAATLVYEVGAAERPPMKPVVSERGTRGFSAEKEAEPASRPASGPVSNRGAISFVALETAPRPSGDESQQRYAQFWPARRPEIRVPARIEQADPSGKKRSFDVGTDPTFSPSWFDAARPFTIVLAIPEGERDVPTHILTSLPWRPPPPKTEQQQSPR